MSMYLDKWEDEAIDYDTACERVYDAMEWDDLEKKFMEGMRSGRFNISDFWDKLPEWIQISVDDDAFNTMFDERYEEIEEEEEEE